MNNTIPVCGDINDMLQKSPRTQHDVGTKTFVSEDSTNEIKTCTETMNNKNINHNEITPQVIDDNEIKLKERIAQCRSLIESLKNELTIEKSKLEKEAKPTRQETSRLTPGRSDDDKINFNKYRKDISIETNLYSACMDGKLNYDEKLIEYEKQLQRYQNTLNMAQIEKKNAIRKQMLAKAFNLKLLEVENQCNIELLRVKQSLQCLKPLRMIANKWKSNTEETYDLNYELIPRYPEINSEAFNDFSKTVADLAVKMTAEKLENNLEYIDKSLDC